MIIVSIVRLKEINGKNKILMAEQDDTTKETYCRKKHVFSVSGGTYTCRKCNEQYRKF